MTILNKTCSRCKEIKPFHDFYFRWDKPHLYQSHCKLCIRKKTKDNTAKNPQRKKMKDREYHLKNRSMRLAYLKEWQTKNKHLRYSKDKIRCLNDLNFYLRQRLHNRLRMAIKRNLKYSSTEELLGCSIGNFKEYFASLFKDGMTWEKFMFGEIHIDHIIPCALFDLSKEENQIKCFHYSNLQPLYAIDNILKRDRLEVCHF